MAKSNRRRKADRARRQSRASQKRAAAQARLVADETIRGVLERYGRLLDPGTPAVELAGLVGEQYGGEPVSSLLVDRMMANGASHQRLAEAAQAMLGAGAADGSPPSLTALTFAAAVSRTAGDADTARELLDRALAAAEDPDTRVALAQHLSAGGRLADAVELLEARLREAPDDDHAAERYGALTEEAYTQVRREPLAGGCPCGQGARWQDCCGPRVHAALSRFTDRSGMTALSDAVGAYLGVSDYGRAVEGRVSEWLPPAEDLGWEPAERAVLGGLAAELALLTASLSGTGEAEDPRDPPGPAGEDDADTPLAAFAADSAVPGELAAKAAVWREHIHYGLWRVDDPHPAPGLWCTDIVSGVTRYAEFPAGLTGGMPRWAVWLGGLVPVDGVWRSTGLGFRLSPAEADAAAELVHEAADALVQAIAGKRPNRPAPPATGPLKIGRAEPLGVYADLQDPVPPGVSSLMGKLTGALMPRIVTDVHEHRSTPPALRNTDGDEMCLITAQISVSDSGEAARQLAVRPDFERDAGDPDRIAWYGLPIPQAQRAAMLAEVSAQLRAQGYAGAEVEEPATPQRWVRGTLRVGDGQIMADVNSAQRLARLLGILARIGAAPVVTDEKQVDPAQDFAWSAGERASPGGAASPSEGWEKHWLDEHVPALSGRTPRQAALGKERPRLETLLRQFEYEAELLTAEGKSGVDTGWLRQELDMTDSLER